VTTVTVSVLLSVTPLAPTLNVLFDLDENAPAGADHTTAPASARQTLSTLFIRFILSVDCDHPMLKIRRSFCLLAVDHLLSRRLI
jgi:hypothetical protein